MKKAIISMLYTILLISFISGCGPKMVIDPPQKAATVPAATQASIPEPTPTPEPTPEPKLFPWNGRTLCLSSVQDDGNITMTATQPIGRFIKLTLDCTDGVVTWEELTGQIADFTLRDADGNDYEPLGSGMKTVDGKGFNIADLDTSEFSALQPIFDIPAALALDKLTLRVKSEELDESILVELAGVPLYEAPEKAE